jgi:hypothetical protein
MEEQELGPNGSLIYCMEYLLDNIYWLIDRLAKLKSHYIIFDCPGQVHGIVFMGIMCNANNTGKISGRIVHPSQVHGRDIGEAKRDRLQTVQRASRRFILLLVHSRSIVLLCC